MIKKIILDLDGTLINSERMFMDAYSYALKDINGNKNYSWDDIQLALGPNEIGVLKKLAPNEFEKCLKRFYAKEKELLSNVYVFKGIKEFLSSCLKKSIQLSVVTGRGREHADFFLKHFNLDNFFDCVLTGNEFKDMKSENIRMLINDNLTTEVIYIGDTLKDVIAAKEAGILSALCTWKDRLYIDKKENIKADYIFNSVEELNILELHNA